MSTSQSGDWNDSDPPLIYRSWRTVCAASFLVYASLGCVLPMLSLFLRTSTAFSWGQTSVVVAGLPLGSALALPLIRRAHQRHYDPRLGTAFGQLLFSGLAMSVVMLAQGMSLLRADWRWACGLGIAAGALSTWTLSWLHELASQTSPKNPNAAREWRLWGAVGFVLPAWCTELAIGRITSVVWDQFEVLYTVSAWTGMAAVVVLVLAWRQEVSVRIEAPSSESSKPTTSDQSVSWLLLLPVMGLAVLQRCHEFWAAPFIDLVLERHAVAVPLTLRLSVVGHVAEVAMLYGLGRLIWWLGARLTMLLGLTLWVARCVTFAVIAQTPLSAREALSSLFLGQVLGGLATVLFAGSFAVVVGRNWNSRQRGLTSVVGWSGVMAAIGVVVAGALTDAALTKVGFAPVLRLIEWVPERIHLGSQVFVMREWSGLWISGAVIPLLAMPLVLFAKRTSS